MSRAIPRAIHHENVTLHFYYPSTDLYKRENERECERKYDRKLCVKVHIYVYIYINLENNNKIDDICINIDLYNFTIVNLCESKIILKISI